MGSIKSFSNASTSLNLNVEDLIVDAGINKIPKDTLLNYINKLSPSDKELLSNQVEYYLKIRSKNYIDLEMKNGALIIKEVLNG